MFPVGAYLFLIKLGIYVKKIHFSFLFCFRNEILTNSSEQTLKYWYIQEENNENLDSRMERHALNVRFLSVLCKLLKNKVNSDIDILHQVLKIA